MTKHPEAAAEVCMILAPVAQHAEALWALSSKQTLASADMYSFACMYIRSMVYENPTGAMSESQHEYIHKQRGIWEL